MIMTGKLKKNTSLSRVYKGMVLIMIPVLILGAAVSFTLGKNIQKQATDVLRGNMDLQVDNLLKTLNNINYCLMDNLNNNKNLHEIQDKNRISKFNAIIKLKYDLSEFEHYFSSDYHFFSYDMSEGRIYGKTPEDINYKTFNEIQRSIKSYMSNSDKVEFQAANRRWNLIEAADGTQLLIKVYKNKGNTIGCWILLDTIEKNFGVNSYSNHNSYMFLAMNGKILTNSVLYDKVAKGNTVYYYKSTSGNTINGNNICYYDFYKGSFSILSVIDTMGNYENNIQVLYAFIFLLFIFIGVGIGLLYYIRYKLIAPIRTFMEHLQNFDEESVKEDNFKFTELKEADELFRKAKQQIKDLKIAIYEKELQKKQLEQDYVQVQIKPHFYLNCLNIIYNMAQTRRFEEIQKLSMEVSKYMRTLFRSGMDFILVKEEMEHLKGYLNIQEFRYTNNFTYRINVEEALIEKRILPLIVHTIVENSIKHTIMKQSVIHIEVTITQVHFEGNEYIKIVVWDTGDGFDEKILKDLQEGKRLATREGGRIGLSNMLQRLEYVYKNQAKISFCNRPDGGAEVEICLPELYN